MNFLKKYLFSPFQNDWKFLLAASLPALLLCLFGLSQLDCLTRTNFLATETVKLACEFLFLGVLLSCINLLGIKNKWFVGASQFVYCLTLIADLILLWYFKERFGAKYLDTMEGGDYGFLLDPRVIGFFSAVALYCAFCVKRFFVPATRKTACHRLGLCLAGLFVLFILNPLKLLPAPNHFYTSYLIPPSVVYTTHAVLADIPQANLVAEPEAEVADLAEKYNVFSARNTPVGKKYTRVILIAAESLSNKYLHHFNPLIPPQATQELDRLYEQNPSVSLKHVTLSTLYGLSVIFTSHPYAQLSYENGYPVSFVRLLKNKGYKTAFLRGANETYMNEHLLFKDAGFEEVIGATYFQTRPEYKNYINWWGLTDRKLFDYALEYLEEQKDNPVFITLLTVDSHVPLGRLDYLDHSYREIDEEFYRVPTLPRAFARFGQDVERFLSTLKAKGLFDENTLVLITPDHPSYSNTPTNALFKPYDKNQYDNLPFIILTKDKITAPLTDSPLASQLDIAPTVLDLLNIPQPKAFFGHSLFDTQAQRSVFDIKEDYAVITTEKDKYVMPLNSRKPQDRALLKLMTTFITE